MHIPRQKDTLGYLDCFEPFWNMKISLDHWHFSGFTFSNSHRNIRKNNWTTAEKNSAHIDKSSGYFCYFFAYIYKLFFLKNQTPSLFSIYHNLLHTNNQKINYKPLFSKNRKTVTFRPFYVHFCALLVGKNLYIKR